MNLVQILFSIIGVLFLLVLYYRYRFKRANVKYKDISFKKKSSEVRLGQIAEELAPFLKHCAEFNPKDMHFMGQPIDYIVYDPKRVVFMEVKSGGAKLSEKQRAIKKLIQDRKVEWKEIRINGK